MKKCLSALLATMLCVCCLGLAACGDSGSSESTSSSASESESASASASEATESSSAAADPSEKFLGDWKMAGMEMEGVTIVGDLTQFDVGTATLNIAEDGTGEVALDEEKASFSWTQTDENTLSIEVEAPEDEATISSIAKAVYQDDTVRMTIETEDQEGTIIFSKDGTMPGITALSMDDATDITSGDALVGTWKISALTMQGATAYGDSASLSAINGGDEVTITFAEDGTVTLFGGEASWSIGDNGAVISEEGIDVPVKAMGDDILVNVGVAYDMEMIMRFSR